MNSTVELDNITKVILESKKILILTHESPDGDAVGSSLAMYIALKNLKKDVGVIIDEYSKVFADLPNISEVNKNIPEEFDLIIALDCASIKRLYDPQGYFNKCLKTISLDHHASNTYYATYNFVEGNSPAASQVILKLFKKLNITLTKEICECLISGIITDTGGFRYDTVNSETFDFASKILDLGVNISSIYTKVYQSQTKSQFMLSKLATERLEFIYKDKIAFTYITLEDEKKYKAQKGDHEGIVNIGRNVEGVRVSLFLHESKDGYKISLRGDGSVNVSNIAEIFGGGGHRNAAGAIINDTLENVRESLIKEIKKVL